MSWSKVSKEYAKLAVGLRRGTSVRSSAATDYYATFTEKKPSYCIKFYRLSDNIDDSRLYFNCFK